MLAVDTVMRAQPPSGYIHLVLYQPPKSQPQLEDEFYLEIPVSFIERHFCSPLKFLIYLGWCILGTYGSLHDEEFQEVRSDGQLKCTTYYYRPEMTDNILEYAVDLEVIQARGSSYMFKVSTGDAEFLANLRRRENRCIFTGMTIVEKGVHIIPRSRGDEWLQLIIANRPNDEPVSDLISIDDIRNGMTPNAILKEDDIVPRCQRSFPISSDSSYPTSSRYTYQSFEEEISEPVRRFMPDNNDATFLISTPLPKPSGLLLNYNYGAAAVKHWGRNISIFSNRPGILRPQIIPPIKRESPAKEGDDGSDADAEWDADDIVLFFWANSKAARERRENERQELENRIEDWQSSVPKE